MLHGWHGAPYLATMLTTSKDEAGKLKMMDECPDESLSTEAGSSLDSSLATMLDDEECIFSQSFGSVWRSSEHVRDEYELSDVPRRDMSTTSSDLERIGDTVAPLCGVDSAFETASNPSAETSLPLSKGDCSTAEEARPGDPSKASLIIRSLCDDSDSSASSPRSHAAIASTSQILAKCGRLNSSYDLRGCDDDEESVDSGVSGPPRSRLTAYDLGCDACDPQLKVLETSLACSRVRRRCGTRRGTTENVSQQAPGRFSL
eukprot:TRINITY_DN40038_c0_g1_i1.p1 TRINITY_DN40038_c0_g1~~TRINITY_DN40038_c0_g1_i1.p1  ORF type:complete len:260 (+),score=27.80 TRINITY_DN40038_c0_g1_i1:79-858(+)